MKTYRIKDNDGNVFEVNEVTEEPVKDDEVLEEEVQVEEEPPLTSEEIRAIRELLAKAAAPVEDAEPEEEEVEEVEEDEDDEEEIVDTKAKDAKKSFGSVEKQVKDSVVDDDLDLSIENAWKERFGGK